MTGVQRYAVYDPFAWFYNRYWSAEYPGEVLRVIDRVLLPRLPARARVLDVCCGTGQIAAALVHRGLRVTGIDGSAEMLRYAAQNAPSTAFLLADARSFALLPRYAAALSTFDSLNHVLSIRELQQVFRNVQAALTARGYFLFDLNDERGFHASWPEVSGIVEEDHVWISRGEYDSEKRLGQLRITLFRLEQGAWKRADVTITERCYDQAEVRDALGAAGFADVETFDSQRDFGMPEMFARTFYLARKAAGAARPGDRPL
jgi:SAM-dependent methyltransferase